MVSPHLVRKFSFRFGSNEDEEETKRRRRGGGQAVRVLPRPPGGALALRLRSGSARTWPGAPASKLQKSPFGGRCAASFGRAVWKFRKAAGFRREEGAGGPRWPIPAAPGVPTVWARGPAPQSHASVLHLRGRRATRVGRRGSCRAGAAKGKKRRIFWKREAAQTLLWFCYKDHFLPDPADGTLCACGGLSKG